MPPKRSGSELNCSNGVMSSSLSMMHARAQNDPGENELATKSYSRRDADQNYLLSNDSDSELKLFFRNKNIKEEEIRH